MPDLKVLYEDNHLLIVEKPVNMPVQADSSKDLDLLTTAKHYIKVKYNKPGDVFLGLVHRLDRPVGGAIVFAKTSKAASRLADQLRLRKIERQYLAVTYGEPKESKGKFVDYLYKNRKENQSYVVKKGYKEAKRAVLTYKILDRKQDQDLNLVKIELETGRSHQIRVQLSHHGLPLWGDQKYAADLNKPGQQIALWAYKLSLKHPTKDEIISVVSQPPLEFPWDVFDVKQLVPQSKENPDF